MQERAHSQDSAARRASAPDVVFDTSPAAMQRSTLLHPGVGHSVLASPCGSFRRTFYTDPTYARIPCRDSDEENAPHPHHQVDQVDSLLSGNATVDAFLLRYAHPDKLLRWHSWAQECVETTSFQMVCAGVITANAVCIGLETDEPDAFRWDIIENVFLLCFSFDLGLRILAEGLHQFFSRRDNPEFLWNAFDTSLVSVGVIDLLSSTLLSAVDGLGWTTLLRIVRLLRIMRVFRIVRVLKQLYLLAYGFVEGATAVFWVAILMGFVLYITSICVVRVFGHEAADKGGDYEEFVATAFGTVPRTMLTLFELIAQPDLKPFHEAMFRQPSLGVFLLTFIIFGSFGLIALLTGVISESIFEKNQFRLEEERMERETRRASLQRECAELFKQIDADNSGTITLEELRSHSEGIRAWFLDKGVGFAAESLDSTFSIMDTDNSDSVEETEFVHGLLQLCEEVKPMSIMELHYALQKCTVKVDRCDHHVENIARAVEEMAAEFRSQVRHVFGHSLESRTSLVSRVVSDSLSENGLAGGVDGSTAAAPLWERLISPASAVEHDATTKIDAPVETTRTTSGKLGRSGPKLLASRGSSDSAPGSGRRYSVPPSPTHSRSSLGPDAAAPPSPKARASAFAGGPGLAAAALGVGAPRAPLSSVAAHGGRPAPSSALAAPKEFDVAAAAAVLAEPTPVLHAFAADGVVASAGRQISDVIAQHFHVLVEAQRRSEGALERALLAMPTVGGGTWHDLRGGADAAAGAAGSELSACEELAGVAEALADLQRSDAERLEALVAQIRGGAPDDRPGAARPIERDPGASPERAEGAVPWEVAVPGGAAEPPSGGTEAFEDRRYSATRSAAPAAAAGHRQMERSGEGGGAAPRRSSYGAAAPQAAWWTPVVPPPDREASGFGGSSEGSALWSSSRSARCADPSPPPQITVVPPSPCPAFY